MVPNRWLGVGSRMWNSRYYDPSVADARFPLAGQNQSFCPVNEQAASHGYLPPLPLQESQADGNNRLNRAIQRKVLLAYIQCKNSAAVSGNDAPACFANYLHSTVCCRYACRCTKFFSLASHYDGCHDARCDICNTVGYSAVVDTFHPDFEHVEGGSGDSGQPTYGSSEAMQPLPKRLKLENPTAPVSYNSEEGVELLPKVLDDWTIANRMGMNMELNTEFLPYPTEDSTSAKEMSAPVSYNSEVGVELLPKVLDDSTIANRIGMNMELNTELLPYPTEDSTSAKEMTAPVFYNSEVGVELLPKVLDDSTIANRMGMNMELNTEFLTYPTEDSTSAKEMNIELLPKPSEDSTGPKEMEEWSMEWISKLIEDSSNAKEMAESFPGPPEVAIAGYKVVETDGVGSHREEDIGFINVIDNARGHFNNALPSFSEELAAGCEEGET
ncbi:uncharacterized protein [Gossypium hirsutum]|uniref:Uncharacterized protein n=1 Tax=Gossypium hirsutum TaxID=3635 RepID=A0ABM3ABE1_GOSHI|nr:uncharacterized protein LOC121218668 [Gossypium hirsutum]